MIPQPLLDAVARKVEYLSVPEAQRKIAEHRARSAKIRAKYPDPVKRNKIYARLNRQESRKIQERMRIEAAAARAKYQPDL